MAVSLQIDLVPRNLYSLGAQPQSLFESGLPRESDSTAGAHNTMPWNPFPARNAQTTCLAAPGMAAGRRDGSIRGHAAFRNTTNFRQYVVEHSTARRARQSLSSPKNVAAASRTAELLL
jgi:hypothetical protein